MQFMKHIKKCTQVHLLGLISEHLEINKMLNGDSSFRGQSFEMSEMVGTFYRLLLPDQDNFNPVE